MAVEIPVVIDIDAAFQAAAKRVGVALVPLRDTIEKLTKDLGRWQEVLSKTKIGDDKFIIAAKNIQNVSEKLAEADYEMRRIATNEGSIKRMSVDLAELNRRWTEMGKSQKFDSAGNLTADAQKLWQDYKLITAELQKEGQSLAHMAEEEKKVLDAAKKRQELQQKGAQKRQYENAILNSTVKTMRVLQEQERILSDRLSRTAIGTDKYKKLQEDLRKVKTDMQMLTGATNTATAAFSRQNGVIARLTSTLASYASIYTLIRFAKQIRDVTAEFEYQRVALGHLIQDEEYGNALFEKIKEKAVESPFRIKDLVTYTKQLASYRIEQEQLFETMDRLADVSAGLGVDMNRLILAYGQVRAASVLRGQELRQFTEAGIPLVQLLADKFTELNGKAVKTADVFELISKRAVPFSMISEIFEDMTDAGGMFYQMQETQAETIRGKWEKLKDVFDKSLQAIGETKTFTDANQRLLGLLNALARNLEYIPKVISAMTYGWVAYSAAMLIVNARHKTAITDAMMLNASMRAREVGVSRITAAVLGQAKAEELLTKVFVKQRIATNALSRAFWKLTAAMLTNPIAILATTVAALYGLFKKFNVETDKVVNSFEDFDKVIEDTSTGLREYEKVDKLIDKFERLATKTDRTVKENNKLYDTMTNLQERFKDVEIGISAENDALDRQIEKLRELNSENEKEARRRGEGILGAKQVELTEAERKREKLYKERIKLIKKVADLEKELQFNDLYKESPEWKKAKMRIGEINDELKEQDKLVSGLQKRIQRLYYILNPESAENPFNAWQRQIQAMRDITVGDITSQIFTDEQIDKWETLDAALSDIDKRKNEVRKREEQLSDAIKNQTGEIKEQIQAELDWARAERVRLEAMEEFFKSPTLYGKDIIENFSKLLARTYDEGNLKSYGKALLGFLSMQTNIKFNPELLSRPLVDAARLAEKGWEDAGEGIATVFSSIYDWEDKDGGKHNIMVTPILPDGDVLSPAELDEYVKGVLDSADFADPKHLVLGIDVSGDAGEKLHEMQEEFYGLMQMRDNLPEKFLITDAEVANLKTATDVLALVEGKIKAVEEEFKKIEDIKLDPNIGPDVIDAAAQYEEHLKNIYDWLIQLRGRYTEPLSGIAKEVKGLFPNLMEEAFRGMDKETFAKIGLFSDEDLKKITNVIDLYGIWAQKIQDVTKEMGNYNKELSTAISEDQRIKIMAAIESLTPQKEGLEELGRLYGFVLKEKETHPRAEQDPWILIYKNRIKFMQDFRDGVEDLDKFMEHEKSLAKQREIMEGRGAALGFDVKELSGSREELLGWYDETIEKIKKKIGALGGRTWSGLGVQAILAKDTKSRVLKAWQDLLADVFKARTDFDLGNAKKDLEEELKRLADEVKRSDAARNFYKDILDLTGDEDLAANMSISIYGDTGDSLREKMAEELKDAFILNEQKIDADGLDVSDVKKRLAEAIASENTVELRKLMKYVVDENRSAAESVVDAWEKADQDILHNFAETLSKYASAENKRKMISMKTSQEIQGIFDASSAMLNTEGITENERERIRQMRDELIKALKGKEELELFKLSDDYIAFFAEINILTAEQAALVRGELRQAYFDAFNSGAIDADILRRNLRAIDEQFKKLSSNASLLGEYLSNGIDGAINKLQEYTNSIDVIAAKMRKGEAITENEQGYVTKMLGMFGSQFGGEELKGINSYQALIESFSKNGKGIQGAGDAFGKMGQGISAAASKAGGAIAMVDAIVNAVNQSIEAVQELIDELNRARSEENKIGGWYRYISDFNKYAFKGWNDLKSGNGIGVLVDIVNSIVSIFNNIKISKVKKLDEEIEAQSDIIGELDYQYQRLENSIQKAFGSDYIVNYNKQLDTLYAKQKAYEEQARLEREKGKASDSDKIKQYEESARDAGDAILDMEGKVAEFFAGTDITSAAKDFATSWIEAYKEFGSTTDAMKEKFQNMIQEMIVNSLAADIMQKQLKPVFGLIDTLAEDGALSAADIADIANLANTVIPQANDALLNTMTLLNAAGYNVRQQPGQFTGIKRNIANATEESVNGLTQAMNVNNFYMSHIPAIDANVAQILAIMTGGTAENPATGASYQLNSDQVLQYMSALPNIDQNIAELLRYVKSVISDKNSSSNINVVAVRA